MKETAMNGTRTPEKKPVFERNRFQTVSYELPCPALPEAFDGFSFVFLTDLHGKTFGPNNETLIAAIRDSASDAVLIGGDMMIAKKRKKMDFSALEAIFTGLGGSLPVYYGEGNHESRIRRETRAYPGWFDAFSGILQKYKVTYLRNRTVLIKRGNQSIGIAGLTLPESLYRHGKKKPAPENFAEKRLGKAGGFTILLLHSPSYFEEAADWGADVTLSGHFHGGTIALGKRGLMTPQFTFFEERVRGCFDFDGRFGVVSAGLGTHSVNLRMWNPPELIKIILRKA